MVNYGFEFEGEESSLEIISEEQGLSEESSPKPEEQCQGEILRNIIEFQKQVDADEKNQEVKDVKQPELIVEEVLIQNTAEEQQVDVPKMNHVVKHVKQPELSVEQILLQHNAAASAERATNPKNSWKARNGTFNQAKQVRIRTTNRTPGRRAC